VKKKLLWTIALALMGTSLSATATTVDLGELSANESVGESLFYSDSGVDIDDLWTFTLTETLVTAITIDANDLEPFFGISGFTADSGAAEIEFTYDADDNAWEFVGTLAAGDYSFGITGLTSGSLGGQYEVAVGGVPPSPIPLPPAFALFFGSLLLLLRRRAS
jgi:hypothetical protein